jgi:hypothetical protein
MLENEPKNICIDTKREVDIIYKDAGIDINSIRCEVNIASNFALPQETILTAIGTI